jgi:hypothetical protein
MAALASLLAMGSADRASAKVKPEEEMRWALYVTMPPPRGSTPASRGR